MASRFTWLRPSSLLQRRWRRWEDRKFATTSNFLSCSSMDDGTTWRQIFNPFFLLVCKPLIIVNPRIVSTQFCTPSDLETIEKLLQKRVRLSEWLSRCRGRFPYVISSSREKAEIWQHKHSKKLLFIDETQNTCAVVSSMTLPKARISRVISFWMCRKNRQS